MSRKRTFIDMQVSREHCYAIGIERENGQPYVSIPVSNQRIDYEEYYRIDQKMFDRFMADPAEALAFVERCRRREEDERLICQPSIDRGSAL